MIEETELKELRERFSDLLNYEVDDPLGQIDPLTYLSPEGACLHIAALRGDYRAVELLVKAGMDINQPGDMGNTPLHYAKKYGNIDIAKLIVLNGASTNSVNDFGEIT